MRHFILLTALLITQLASATDSTMSISLTELKTNHTVAMISHGDDSQMPPTASRIIQLQLKAAGCSAVVTPKQMFTVGAQNDFAILSDDCFVREKAGATCDEGYTAKNLPANPNVSGDTILGSEKYKVCVKTAAPSAGRSNTRGAAVK